MLQDILDRLQPLVGTEIGVSDWLTIDQDRIDAFADATGDHQWIHVDAEKAAAGPFGSTIAHGFLTLSLTVALTQGIGSTDELKSGSTIPIWTRRTSPSAASGTCR